MRERIKTIATAVVPALLALFAVLFEERVTKWASDRQAILPLALILVFAAFLHPRLRLLLTNTLCYGVAFLALRDVVVYHNTPLPPTMDYAWLIQARMVALCLVSALAIAAAVTETFRPGTVWARRCYFGAAAIYFTGLGITNLGWHPSWQALLLCGAGLASFGGLLYAERIIASEEEEIEEEMLEEEADDDERAQQEREAAHRKALLAKEWRDTLT